MKTIYNVLNAEDIQLNDEPFNTEEEAIKFKEEQEFVLFPPEGLQIVSEEVKTWEDFMPTYVSLYYVDYNSDLDHETKTLQECLSQNSMCPLDEKIWDWWDFPEEYYLKDILEAMRQEGLECEYDEHLDEIRDYLYEHDTSDPIHDLLRNTTSLAIYYDLGYQVDGWHEAFLCEPWRNTSEEDEVSNVAKILGISRDSKQWKDLETMVCQADSGELRIYFPMDDLEALINNDVNDFKSIRFKGRFAVGVIDVVRGGGDVCELDLDVEFPFVRANLIFSDCDHYSWEDIAGTYTDWCKNYHMPVLSMDEPKSDIEIAESSSSAEIKRQAQYEATYRAGGCTLGDTDIRRHRGVYYRNDFPCGSVCPHCGQFWID